MMRILGLLAVLGFVGWLSVDRIEAMLIYPFDGTEISTADAGLPGVIAHRFETGGETLVVWTAAPKPGKPVVFYLHGNAGNLAARAGRFEHFLRRGYGIVAPAYRGSSGSTGTPNQQDIEQDIRAVWMSDLVPPGPRILYGESLGTGVAVLSITAPPFGDSVKGFAPAGVLLEAPYTSIPDVALHSYPQLASLADIITNTWRSIDGAPMITMPLLVLHGTNDTLIPIDQGRAIFDAAPTNDKRFLAVKGASHTTLWRSDTLPIMWRFIDRL